MGTQDDKRKPGRPTNPVGRPKLIELARGIFAQAGYAGASLSQIASAAGIRKASLYHHFDTKEALYLSVLDSVIGDLQKVFIAAISGTGSFTDRLHEATHVAVNYLAKNPDAAKILLREAVDGGPFVQAHGTEAIDMTLSVAAQFFQAGMTAGEFEPQNPFKLMLAITGMCLFAFSAEDVSMRLLARSDATERTIAKRVQFLQAQIYRMAIKT
jgi:TetR/AcrR family transcriptional regulator